MERLPRPISTSNDNSRSIHAEHPYRLIYFVETSAKHVHFAAHPGANGAFHTFRT